MSVENRIWTSLHQAAMLDNIESVLQSHKQYIYQIDEYGRTPLHVAAEYNKPKAITTLVNNGAEIEKKMPEGFTPLHIATLVQSLESLAVLIKLNANINAYDNAQDTSLHMAAKLGNLNIIRLLMDNEATFNLSNINKMTPLSVAIYHSKKEVVGLFVNTYKISINQASKEGISPLHVAIVFKDAEFIEELIENYNVNLNQIDNKGRSPLKLAAQYDRFSIIRLLLKHDATTDGIDDPKTLKMIQDIKNDMAEIQENIVIYYDFSGENNTHFLDAY